MVTICRLRLMCALRGAVFVGMLAAPKGAILE